MANSDSIQDYIESLKTDLKKVETEIATALKTESKNQNLLDKQKSWSAFLSKTVLQLKQTDGLGASYLAALENTQKAAVKATKNYLWSLKGLNILVCQASQVADCIEVLQPQTNRLATVKDSGTLSTDIDNLQKAVDEAMAAVLAAIKAILVVYQTEEDLFKSLDGNDNADRGLVKQISWMTEQVIYAHNADPELLGSCSNCTKSPDPVFPLDNSSYYADLVDGIATANTEITNLTKKLATETCNRERIQNKRDALQAALTAAEAAKACDSKPAETKK